MPAIVRHKKFTTDLAKVRFADSQFDKFVKYLSLLQAGAPLLRESSDHVLKGNWQGHREFHLGGDLLVIYRITPDAVELVRIGTHSQLFE